MMSEIDKQQYLGAFLKEFQLAHEAVNQWPADIRNGASRTGVLAFPRIEEQVKESSQEGSRKQ
jgi:hypothetical protein